MIKFQYPFLFLLLGLPWLMGRFKRQDLEYIRALKWPYFNEMNRYKNNPNSAYSGSIYSKALLWVIWTTLIFALSSPQWIGEPIELPRSGRDIMLAIDVSPSMEWPDIRSEGKIIDRLTAVKEVAKEFVAKRQGDRLGLILFGTHAYLQTPLTFDRKTVQYMIDDATPKLAGNLTAIGDAIGLAVKRLRGIESKSKILILLTDGVSNSGEVNPITASEMAAEAGIKIYTIGLGAQRLVVPGFFGPQVINPSEDLDEETLKKISEKTHGMFFRSIDKNSLKSVYDKIDQLEPTSHDAGVYLPRKDLYYWPLSVSFILSILLLIKRTLI